MGRLWLVKQLVKQLKRSDRALESMERVLIEAAVLLLEARIGFLLPQLEPGCLQNLS